MSHKDDVTSYPYSYRNIWLGSAPPHSHTLHTHGVMACPVKVVVVVVACVNAVGVVAACIEAVGMAAAGVLRWWL